jgi:phage baseplate assembly protein W
MVLYGSQPSREVDKTITLINSDKVMGVGFPFGKNSKNYVNSEYGSALLKSQIRQLLLTDRGERVMLPNFGIGIRRFLFDPYNEDTKSQIEFDIVTSIENYLPTVRILELRVNAIDSMKYSGLSGIQIVISVVDTGTNAIADVEVTL